MCHAENAILKMMIQNKSSSPVQISQNEEETSPNEKEIEIPLNDVILKV